MNSFENTMRVFVMKHFVDRGPLPLEEGRAPDLEEIAQGVDPSGRVRLDRVRAALENLAADDAVLLEPDDRYGVRIRMAIPFSAVPTPHVVTAGDSRWYGNCAMDSLGVPVAVGRDAVITTEDPIDGRTLEVEVNELGATSDEIRLVHFLTPVARVKDKVHN